MASLHLDTGQSLAGMTIDRNENCIFGNFEIGTNCFNWIMYTME